MKILNYQYITFTIVKEGHERSMNSLDRLLKQRDIHVGKAFSIAHGKPLHITKGEMQYLFSATGEKYLD